MKIKLWISLVLAFFVFIFITQNTATANVRFLAWSIEMSLVLIVFIMLALGMILGWLLNSYVRYSKHKKQENSAGQRADDPVGQQHQVNSPAENKKEES